MDTVDEKTSQLIVEAAKAAHEVNRIYCQSIGDDSQVAWEHAPVWQKQSAIEGAHKVLTCEDWTPARSHRSWMDNKKADGWQYGPVKDPAKKLHPCIVPYAKLPVHQRAKDSIFNAVVLGVFAKLAGGGGAE
jgi:hypothetical protein